MSDEMTNTTVVDDEMPTAPAVDGSHDAGAAAQIQISGEMEAATVERGIDIGEPVPEGIYHLRLEKYSVRGKMNDDGQGPDPYFNAEFEVIQPEQFAGRRVFDNIPWLRDVDRKRAAAGDPVAEKKAADRMGKIKNFQKACNFAPAGSYNVFKDFLDKKPECKAQVTMKQRMKKDEKGEYTIKVAGQFDNNIKKYIPLL